MPNLTQIVDRFKSQVEANDNIGTFVFDDLTSVNIDRGKSYPLLLLKPPTSVIEDLTRPTGTLENYSIRFYLMDTYHMAEQKNTTLYEKWDNLKQVGLDFIQGYQDRAVYKLTNPTINVTMGSYEHNDSLMVVAFEFKLTVHNCY